ncbi:LysM peptidoglycan-binding domain-containing protein [Thalassomonas sp. M1454]|uniref:LysM peptidoglycan-binding domain-containing protein n=1 Tax=Thalassomonas sp. M1454 TaxID=2594477 RepID=UPI00117CACB0|nr:LysM peptidoglycan-binding domain-containing protein [Thalassomonas sp. M1454]TRX56744.1 LysM peptidoglycan-binding domain-containing protein [Thalassomonas sp. M1454]
MKKILFPLSLTFLVGCQNMQLANNDDLDDYSTANDPSLANNVDIYQALLADESAKVIHPKDDVDIQLSDKDSAVISDNLWDRIRGQLHFDIPQNSKVIAQRNWYAKHDSYMDRVAKRSEPFIYYIVEEIEKHDMPMELVLLPIVESAYDPFAYSHGSASGMWQFLSGTGKQFGLKQDWWYDGRRDVAASTQAAMKFLRYLHKRFDGDWLLALAAYNSGEGRVSRAVRDNARKGKPTDFWNLKLPKETRDYVPKLLALADLVKRPDDFNLTLYAIDNKPVVSQVDIGSQLDLALAADLAGLTINQLHALNPGFNRWATAPNGPHSLLIPNNKVEAFKAGLAKLSKDDRLSWQRYKIKNGDNLGAIANRFNTTITVIKEANNLANNNIRAGKYLLIPTAAQSLDKYKSYEQVRKTKIAKKGSGNKITHTVKSGDTLWDIGQKYKVTSGQIAKWNGFAPKDMLRLGQKLTIWTGSATTASTSASGSSVMRNINYKVRSGDSLDRIANKFKVSISDIERWNKLSRKKYLQPGQMLKLSVNVTSI